ncbi:bacillithiol biosynthesis BshC, partial [Candidatus Desantisbacteria bacterium]|nr:bacillithiol biosynthesis BshC [Candidatus Desantisbacteria bacterium]
KNKYSGGIDKIIEKFKNTLEIAGNDMSLDLKKIDPELFAIYNKSIKPINDAVEKIENRVWRKIEMNEQIIVRQISKLFNNLLPEEDFQERKLNIYYFLNKYGEDFLKILYQSLIIDKPGHNIFCVK